MEKKNKYDIMREKRRIEIIKAAKNLICRKGFSDATIKELAAKLNISRNTLYKYYKGMDSLAYDIAKNIFQEMLNQFHDFQVPENYNAGELISFFINSFFDYSEKNTFDFLYLSLFDAYCCFHKSELYANYRIFLENILLMSVKSLLNKAIIDGTISSKIDFKKTLVIINNVVLAVVQRFSLLGHRQDMISGEDRKAIQQFIIATITHLLEKGEN